MNIVALTVIVKTIIYALYFYASKYDQTSNLTYIITCSSAILTFIRKDFTTFLNLAGWIMYSIYQYKKSTWENVNIKHPSTYLSFEKILFIPILVILLISGVTKRELPEFTYYIVVLVFILMAHKTVKCSSHANLKKNQVTNK
jgi:hypothetical protein